MIAGLGGPVGRSFVRSSGRAGGRAGGRAVGRSRARARSASNRRPLGGVDLRCQSQRECTCERAGQGTQTAHKNSNGERRERTRETSNTPTERSDRRAQAPPEPSDATRSIACDRTCRFVGLRSPVERRTSFAEQPPIAHSAAVSCCAVLRSTVHRVAQQRPERECERRGRRLASITSASAEVRNAAAVRTARQRRERRRRGLLQRTTRGCPRATGQSRSERSRAVEREMYQRPRFFTKKAVRTAGTAWILVGFEN